MSRLTGIEIDASALLHNLALVSAKCPASKIIAMVKANAYGCGLSAIIPILDGRVSLFGVACLEEAMVIRSLNAKTAVLLIQGVFSAEEYPYIENFGFDTVIHQPHQLQWLLETPLARPQKIWIKINTGMNRLGFPPEAVYDIIQALRACPWVKEEIGLMTHFASADEPLNPANASQLEKFKRLVLPDGHFVKSLANSAAILTLPEAHEDYVRPGIMLYGVSPFKNQTGQSLGLKPVMRFYSFLSAIQDFSPDSDIGYGGTWKTTKPSRIGVVAAGYADGYPWNVTKPVFAWVNGCLVPVVGRISMDMLTVDLTGCKEATVGDKVELWGPNLPVETVAAASGTLAYELLCRFARRGILRSERLP